MTLTAVYADDLSRVRLSFTGAPSTADYALIERSTDQITWSTVRGGDTVAISSGAGKLDDYEFSPSVPNYYRASYVDTGPTTFVNVGNPVTGSNAPLAPGIPSGTLPGDLLLILASIRNYGAGTVDTPAGWTALVTSGSLALLGRRYVAGDTAPTITFSGGVAGADTLAQTATFRNVELIPAASNTQANAASQNIAFPAITVPGNNYRTITAGWKQASWTSVDPLPGGYTETGEVIGTGAAMVWDRIPKTTPTVLPSDSFVVTGGVAAISCGMVATFPPAAYLTQDTASITPAMAVAWLKNPRRPNLNTPVTVTEFSAISRPARAGFFPVIGRTMPIAVTDVRGSRVFTLTVTTVDLAAAQGLDARLAQGDTVLLHVPANAPFPGGYYVVGDIQYDRHSKRTLRRFFDLPLTEVAAPAGTVYSQTATYADILAAYATYTTLLAGEPTYSDVLDYIAPAADVITS